MKKKSLNSIIVILIVVLFSVGFAGCSGGNDSKSDTQADTQDETTGDEKSNSPVVVIEMEDGGIIEVQLDREAAPVTVDNFVKLVDQKFYDGTIFHRVIEDFMIQGGGYSADMVPNSTDTIKGEFEKNGWDNPIKHERGVISMARKGDYFDSASGQFFIMHADYPSIDGSYASFGRVISGMEVVDEIAVVETGTADLPKTPVVIKSITLKDA